MIRVDNLTKAFLRSTHEARALNGVSLSVGAGELVTIMGPSGSGKSTLLHLIGGLDAPTSGEVSIRGTPLSRMSDDEITLFRRRHIGFIFQFFHLLPALTVEENVGLPRLLDGHRAAAIRPKVRALLDRVGLSHRCSHRADELSGGEMQRAAIARALVVDPILLLADEPTGNLDSRTGAEVLALIRAVVKDGEHATIMVTHDVRAAAYGDRVVAMRDGRILATTPVLRDESHAQPSPRAVQMLSDWYRRHYGESDAAGARDEARVLASS